MKKIKLTLESLLEYLNLKDVNEIKSEDHLVPIIFTESVLATKYGAFTITEIKLHEFEGSRTQLIFVGRTQSFAFCFQSPEDMGGATLCIK